MSCNSLHKVYIKTTGQEDNNLLPLGKQLEIMFTNAWQEAWWEQLLHLAYLHNCRWQSLFLGKLALSVWSSAKQKYLPSSVSATAH